MALIFTSSPDRKRPVEPISSAPLGFQPHIKLLFKTYPERIGFPGNRLKSVRENKSSGDEGTGGEIFPVQSNCEGEEAEVRQRSVAEAPTEVLVNEAANRKLRPN